jgi:hypothetical protein
MNENYHQLEFDFETGEKSNVNMFDPQLENEFLSVEKEPGMIEKLLNGSVLFYKIKCRIDDTKRFFISTYQKIVYGVSDEECWNLYETFAKFALKRLKHFKKMRRFGTPSGMFECSVMEHNDEDFKKATEKWENTLDEMIWTFDYILDDEKYNPSPSIKWSWETTNIERKDWEKWQKLNTVLNDRKRKGLLLFAENFESLWD